jgi:hypothetical protein
VRDGTAQLRTALLEEELATGGGRVLLLRGARVVAPRRVVDGGSGPRVRVGAQTQSREAATLPLQLVAQTAALLSLRAQVPRLRLGLRAPPLRQAR